MAGTSPAMTRYIWFGDRKYRLVNLLFSRMNPDRRVGAFGRVSWFSEPELFQTVLWRGPRFHAAAISDRVDLPVTDKRRPERNGNQARARQCDDGEDYNRRRDGDRLLASAVVVW
jgi:hypothetical protein